MCANGWPPRYHYYASLCIPNQSARAFVSDALSTRYIRVERVVTHAFDVAGSNQDSHSGAMDGREKWLSPIHGIYVLFSWKSLKKLRQKISMTLIRILTCLSTWLDNSRALHLCFNFFDNLYLWKNQKIINKIVLFYFYTYTEVVIRSKKDWKIFPKRFYWNIQIFN